MVKGGWGTQLYAVVQIIKFRFCITKYITYLANEALKKKIYSSLRSRWNDWWSKNGRMLINIESGWWLYKRFIIHIPFPLKCSIIKLFFFKSEKEPLGCSDFKAQALFTSHFASKKKKKLLSIFKPRRTIPSQGKYRKEIQIHKKGDCVANRSLSRILQQPRDYIW